MSLFIYLFFRTTTEEENSKDKIGVAHFVKGHDEPLTPWNDDDFKNEEIKQKKSRQNSAKYAGMLDSKFKFNGEEFQPLWMKLIPKENVIERSSVFLNNTEFKFSFLSSNRINRDRITDSLNAFMDIPHYLSYSQNVKDR